ncbi:hypothetical protein F9C07_1353828 [Aspergillus flavus]|uniref:Uncharacterized protein n=1 Tax=Aspergillus flavus (strain ATCC 200026 / FGSC A1120 / IAM 13836 / NRRL 3357 / JCM 12722 / SRRC 167) TaxID=332952 RepID=A0A7G5JYV7_ASPFN|nr:uncharacterized protein G4B84_004017 [Aspergillus flavus NRRL3357]KAF7618624.1 hypothetical protein AFLA_000276 [Aspergillus flavus NRRL3357]QMW28728.1 hypothetical protein G4B84_004017 [Aspergillus flavus NRRL3357]QMW40799.1 hypothetical protein G4B11_004079 [Aspergillus flavus]QRD83259.1 hypothetical protein F9C07_1353828 [Aspergillus flavus]
MTTTADKNYPTPNTPIQTIGLREICEVNCHHFKIISGQEDWIEYSPENTPLPPTQPSPLYLSLIHENQGPDEPLHWSLFVARENEPGWLYQVTGDAEHMIYEPSDGKVAITSSESFLTLYQLASVTEGQAMVVKSIADQETPPYAVNRREVKENCQGWVVRVIGRLVEEGIVSDSKLEMARKMMQPL